MRCRRIWPVLILAAFTLAASGQYTKEFKRIFLEAEYLYETGFYGEAFSRYKNLLTLDPGNHNILFHCGACCLLIPGSERQAVTYLKEAAAGVTLNYKSTYKESGAPVLAYFMLGRACHLNNRFVEAVENYEHYLEKGTGEDPVQREYAVLQVRACERASAVAGASPAYEFKSVLDQFDDDLPSCSRPVISGDGNILIFLVDYPSDKKIMMTTRNGGLWSRPRVINSEIGMVGETAPSCLSYDGKELYLVHHYYSHSDIFVSRFEGGRWTEAEALDDPINGRTSEIHASISTDGNMLYFVSDRRGGTGSFDIYVSRKNESGDWESPVNLGPIINTPFEEHTPFISRNDSMLFFSSQGHSSIGGIDVFYSELNPDGTWKEPVNTGHPVNTTGEDLFFNPGWGEMDGYYAVRRESDPTANTIRMAIELEPPEQADAAVPGDESVFRQNEGGIEADLSKVIEPSETGKIQEVLNRGEHDAGSAPPATGLPGIDEADETASTAILLPVTGSREWLTSVPFDHNSSDLNLAARLEAEKIFDLMQEYRETRAEITGHADPTGSPGYNLVLSRKRAEQVARYLENRGIDRERLTVNGVGQEAPRARNRYTDGRDAPVGRFVNRHVVVRLVSPDPIIAGLGGIQVPRDLEPDPLGKDLSRFEPGRLTIQVRALFRPADLTLYRDLEEVREFACRDGYYRYTTGTFSNMEEAGKKLAELRSLGYRDAFIRRLDWYKRVMGP